MRFNFDKYSFYNIAGKVFIWGIVLLFLLYFAYNIGHQNGKLDGYWTGYSDGYFRLRPASPNLSPEERSGIQKLQPFPKPNKGVTKDENSILVEL
jgi:hypothetical protein